MRKMLLKICVAVSIPFVLVSEVPAVEGVSKFQIESGYCDGGKIQMQLSVLFRSLLEASNFYDDMQIGNEYQFHLEYQPKVGSQWRNAVEMDILSFRHDSTEIPRVYIDVLSPKVIASWNKVRCVLVNSNGDKFYTSNIATVSLANGTVDVESVGGEEDLTGGYWVTFNPGMGVHLGGGELEQYVKYGESAVEPIMASGPFDGYVFCGWDSYDWMYVTTNMTVSAVYEYEYTEEPEPPTPTVYSVEFDEGEHGRISSGWWYQEVYEGQWPEVPEIEPLDGWRFVGWSPEVYEIWGDMTFVAQYEAVPKKINYIAEGCIGEYCGMGYRISVRVSLPTNGWTVKYAESATGPWQDTPILYRDVCTSRPVYFQITADGYETVVDSRTVTITPKQLTGDYVWLVLPPEDYVYDGTPKIPEVAYGDGLPSLITENDFEVRYENNINAGIATVTIVGKGNYTGSVAEHFEIKPGGNGLTSCEVTAVAVKPRWPWNGIVDIDYTLQVEPTNGMAVVTVSGCDTVVKRTLTPRTLSGKGSDGEPVSAGTYRLTWDIGTDYPQFHSEAFTVDVSATPVQQGNGNNDQTNGLYMVIDLSGGTNSVTYPVSYMNEVPAGGWAAEHKTTKLVMRRIEAGSFVMKDKYNVTLTKPFYMGVFEVTQKQYELVTGDNPSKYKGDARPVEMVSWNTIRGDSDIYNWPSNRTVDAASFMGIIQQKTGMDLDLPTEAQWEYVCRAGITSAYNNGGSTTNDLNVLGRYSGNRNDGKGGYSEHTTVGSYLSNVWGLYDMHGNVFEWCLDWYGSLLNGTDPVGSVSGSSRVLRGGSCYYDASTCTSSYRYGSTPSDDSSYYGFRLACSAGQ